MNLKQRREVFKRVAAHLLKQHDKSIKGDSCAYRSNGKMCAVGCLISDEHYSEDLENIVVADEPVRTAVEDSLGLELGKEDVDMLCELQQIHDHAPVDDWRKHLNDVAVIYKLVK